MILALAGFLLVSASIAAPLNADEDAGPRRLVIALDGTGSSGGGDNIIRSLLAISSVSPDGISQIIYYSEGVGSPTGGDATLEGFQSFVDMSVGGLFGSGFEGKVKSAYRFLVSNYRPGDRIVIFGFSRGGAEAQCLVRFIYEAGGLLDRKDGYYIDELFRVFKSSTDFHSDAKKWFSKVHWIKSPRPVAIEFLGLYDPVLSLGLRLERVFGAGDSPPPNVKTVRQALAIDESRWDFRPQIWRTVTSPSQSLVQRWFPGRHSNVGGAIFQGRDSTHPYPFVVSDRLSGAPLQWMMSEAELAGVSIDHEVMDIRRSVESFHAPSWNQLEKVSLWARLGEFLRMKSGRGARPLDRGEGAGIELDDLATSLLIQDQRYRPVNLLVYLAQHEEQITKLPEGQQAAVRGILKQFRARSFDQTSGSQAASVSHPR